MLARATENTVSAQACTIALRDEYQGSLYWSTHARGDLPGSYFCIRVKRTSDCSSNVPIDTLSKTVPGRALSETSAGVKNLRACPLFDDALCVLDLKTG